MKPHRILGHKPAGILTCECLRPGERMSDHNFNQNPNLPKNVRVPKVNQTIVLPNIYGQNQHIEIAKFFVKSPASCWSNTTVWGNHGSRTVRPRSSADPLPLQFTSLQCLRSEVVVEFIKTQSKNTSPGLHDISWSSGFNIRLQLGKSFSNTKLMI